MGFLPAEGRVDALACTHPWLRRYPVREPFTPVEPKKLRARQLTPYGELEMPRKVLGCDGVIAETTSSRDVDTAKPEPGIAQVVLDRAGVNSDQAVFVGDAVWDAHAAAGAGLPCIGVLSGGIAHAELQAAGPIFADPHDLLDHLESTRIAALAPPADRSQLHPTGTQHQRQHPPT